MLNAKPKNTSDSLQDIVPELVMNATGCSKEYST
jgi:hypothetical protein